MTEKKDEARLVQPVTFFGPNDGNPRAMKLLPSDTTSGPEVGDDGTRPIVRHPSLGNLTGPALHAVPDPEGGQSGAPSTEPDGQPESDPPTPPDPTPALQEGSEVKGKGTPAKR
jgi:hypothetical protein